MMPLQLLFVLTLASQYLALASMTVLLSYMMHNTASNDQRKARYLILPLHYAYALLLVAGLVEISTMGSDGEEQDGEESALPLCFLGRDLLMVLNFALLLALKSKKFLLDPPSPSNGQNESSQTTDRLRPKGADKKKPEGDR